jgi:hypothetical protein
MVPHDSALQLTVRWLARAISTLAAGFWLLLLLDISLVAFVTSPARRAYSILVSGVPFLIAGILFLASWWFEQTGIKSTKAV